LDAGLALFGLTLDDPSPLWNYRYLAGTAGYRLKEILRCQGYKPPVKRKENVPMPAPTPLTPEQLADIDNLPPEILPRRRNGKLDVEGSINLMQLVDPADLWKKKVKFGTALHLLKQAIGTNPVRLKAIQLKLQTFKANK
jgi:hypothetical protein